MIYPVVYEDVSPSALRSHPARGYVVLHREPQQTNLGHQPLTQGWLGTTNDLSATALGEFDDDDIEGVVSAVARAGYQVEPETVRHWVESSEPELEIRQHVPDTYEGDAYQFVVTYDDEGNWEVDWDLYEVRDGYVEIDGEVSGALGSDPVAQHDPETWQKALERAGIWYEELTFHDEDTYGSADAWFLYVREADRQRAIEAVEAEEAREEAGDAI